MYKIMLLGGIGTGKSSFRAYFSGNHQNPLQNVPKAHYPSVGIEVGVKTLQFGNNEFVNIQLWDTTGNYAFHSVCQKFYNQMHGFVIFVDLGNRKSLDEVAYWIQKIRNNKRDTNCFIGVVANKLDGRRQFDRRDFENMYGTANFRIYQQISLMTGQNVQQTINELGLEACNHKPNHIESTQLMDQAANEHYCKCQIM